MSDRGDGVNEAGQPPGQAEVSRASVARMYDYFLGGEANTAPDRAAAEALNSVWPGMPHFIRANRAFLGRAVRHLAEAGIDQFLDLGSGLPTMGNVHEVVHAINPDARVAYTDADPVAVSWGKELLAGMANVTMSRGDIRKPSSVLTSPEVAELLDFTRPLAVLAVSTLPYVDDDAEVAAVVNAYRDACQPGSYIVVSHSSPATVTPSQLDRGYSVMRDKFSPVRWREPERIRALLDGYTLLDPGLVLIPSWRPDLDSHGGCDPAVANTYGGVGYLASASYVL